MAGFFRAPGGNRNEKEENDPSEGLSGPRCATEDQTRRRAKGTKESVVFAMSISYVHF